MSYLTKYFINVYFCKNDSIFFIVNAKLIWTYKSSDNLRLYTPRPYVWYVWYGMYWYYVWYVLTLTPSTEEK